MRLKRVMYCWLIAMTFCIFAKAQAQVEDINLDVDPIIGLDPGRDNGSPIPPTTVGAYYSGQLAAGSFIVFTGHNSHDNDAIYGKYTPRWEWDFDYHGTFNPTGAGEYPSNYYSLAGVYTIAVKYFDDDNQEGNLNTFQITIAGLKRLYYLKDHLGTIRATVDAAGQVVSADDYDPWGMQLDGRSFNLADANPKYKFTGKERDIETGYDYFGARYLDARIGRWMSVDPLGEKYAGWSPYNYVLENPLKSIDPNGEDVFIAISGWGATAQGKEGSSETTSSIISEVSNFATSNGIKDFDAIGLLGDFHGVATDKAIRFISDKLGAGEKLIIYGYSLGGDNATELARSLDKVGVKADMLITVDASKGSAGETNRTISGAKSNVNYYQDKPDVLSGARGGPNKAADPKKTSVVNKYQEKSSHGGIDEDVKGSVIGDIEKTMKQND